MPAAAIPALRLSFSRSFGQKVSIPPSSRVLAPRLALRRNFSQTLPSRFDTTRKDESLALPKHHETLSSMVDEYWMNIDHHAHEPGFFSFSSTSPNIAIKDRDFMHKLLSNAISINRGHGDILPNVITKDCCQLYEGLDEEGKLEFFRILATDFGVPREASLHHAINYANTLQHNPNDRAVHRAEQILRHAMTPLHNKFFDRVNHLPGGMKFLVDMRAELLNLIAKHRDDPNLAALNESLKEKLQAWLVGFMILERITWNSSAELLERVAEYESVHAVNGWQDLKRRVGPGRRIFGFFCKTMPNEPLVFVQVALVRELSNNVQEILNDPYIAAPHPDDIQCAVFYSITTQRGLSGIDLGNFLIKRVVRELQHEFPQIQTFCTLSPIPGFRKWLLGNTAHFTDNHRRQGGGHFHVQGADDGVLFPEEVKALEMVGIIGEDGFKQTLRSHDWMRNKELTRIVKPIIMRLCARYVLKEKRRGMALDPVANFHLRNGACAHRLNWMADTSEKGLNESFGMMMNYNYLLHHIEANNQEYLHDGTIGISEERFGEDGRGWLTLVSEMADGGEQGRFVRR